jgi:DNA-binding beta-propeller fold protein YncE
VTDRLQRAVFVYDADGNYLDTILSPDLTLSEYVAAHAGLSLSGDDLAYNIFEPVVHYKTAGKPEQSLPAPALTNWAPLGIRFDPVGNFLVTDVQAERHTVRQIPASTLRAKLWHDFDPPEIAFGTSGQGNGEFQFPNSAVMDSQGLIYVTDGNNGRISVWDEAGEFLFSFGQGIGESALSLPRGAVIDGRDRLHVVDAVEQSIKVYDVSGHEPRFLYTFGAWGDGDGEFNYPNDIALDTTGRLYIADRENNRVQIWSY